MTDKKRIITALEFLKENQGFKVGGLYLAPRKKEIAVVGQTNYNNPDNLNKRIALNELKNIKATFNDYRELVAEFDKYFVDKKIKYCLAYDYGMGGIELCNEFKGNVTWSYKIRD
jgi:succinate dehydrogenase/fumarate reductase flavoprotein subunit